MLLYVPEKCMLEKLMQSIGEVGELYVINKWETIWVFGDI